LSASAAKGAAKVSEVADDLWRDVPDGAASRPTSSAELVEAFLEGLNVALQQRLVLSRILRLFAEVVGPRMPDEDDVDLWLATRSDKAPSTRLHDIRAVRSFWAWLVEQGYRRPLDWTQWVTTERIRQKERSSEPSPVSVDAGEDSEFREYLYGLGLCERTVREYIRELQRAQRWLEEHGHDLGNARPSSIAAYSETRARSWSTRKVVRCTLQHYWTMTGRLTPPVAAVRVPPKPRGMSRALEEDDTALLAKAARERGDDPGLAVALMLYAGLRRNEVPRFAGNALTTTSVG
jgi:hypothetical protein